MLYSLEIANPRDPSILDLLIRDPLNTDAPEFPHNANYRNDGRVDNEQLQLSVWLAAL